MSFFSVPNFRLEITRRKLSEFFQIFSRFSIKARKETEKRQNCEFWMKLSTEGRHENLNDAPINEDYYIVYMNEVHWDVIFARSNVAYQWCNVVDVHDFTGNVQVTCKEIVATSDVPSIERNLAANRSRKGNSSRACKIKRIPRDHSPFDDKNASKTCLTFLRYRGFRI